MAPSVQLKDLPGALPPDLVPQEVDLEMVQTVAQKALESLDTDAFTQDTLWRDWLSLTGQVRTFHSAQRVVETWNRYAASRHPTNFQTKPARVMRPVKTSSWVNVPFTFTTCQDDGLVGHCSGSASLIPDVDGHWKIWVVVTVLENFAGHRNPDVPPVEKNWIDNHGNGTSLEHEFDVVVVGAGQNGLAVAGRLAALGIKYVLLERQPTVGTNWTVRYESVRQHTLREYNNLPFDRTWKPNDPLLLPGTLVAEGFENYVAKYNINLWLSTQTRSCTWDDKSRKWTLEVEVKGDEKHTVHCRHLVLALGAGVSVYNDPKFPGADQYRGVLLNSGAYKHSRDWKDKSGIVVGTGTTAHDVASDMLKAGLSSITMVQRNKTAIYPIEWVIKGQEGLYNTTIPTTLADAEVATRPNKILRDIMKTAYEAAAQQEQERFDALERAGFRVDRVTPMMDNILIRYGGYYIDIGTSSRIASGEIKVKSGVPIDGFTPDGLRFADGSELKSDVIVVATGQDHDYRNQVATIVGKDMAGRLGEFWGLDEEGEMRNVMKPAAPGLWLIGGTAAQARFWSRFYALQIQSDLLGKPLCSGNAKSFKAT